MSLEELLKEGKLKRHKTSKEEIKNLIKVIKRDIQDSQVKGLSTDRKFAIAYNAVLQSATILLYCEGYRAKGIGHHYTIFQTMKGILGGKYKKLADYFDSCRVKRNTAFYGYAGIISEKEANELIDEAENFLDIVIKWLKKNYTEYIEKV
jgi:uncharacterized protein (UPF0332 family)